VRFYNHAHRFYCGVDLHARTMYLCILDHAGQIVLHHEVPADPTAFLEAIAPYRDDLVVACECLFCWYWLADLCQTEQIAFVLGHALYMKAIHGGKAKADKIDSKKIAQLLHGGNLPMAPPKRVLTPFFSPAFRAKPYSARRLASSKASHPKQLTVLTYAS